jgi:hypothetical protein
MSDGLADLALRIEALSRLIFGLGVGACLSSVNLGEAGIEAE